LASRVKVGIGAISVESPVRRKLGEVVDFEELQRITTLARSENIGLHLDGARLIYDGADHGLSEYRSEAYGQIRQWLDRYVRDLQALPDLEPHGD